MNTIDALTSLRPTAKWAVNGDEITWMDEEQTQPTGVELQTEIARLQAEYDSQEYARKRKAEYPTIEELVVALYDTDDKAEIQKRRAEVKAKYPKE
tara:strand:+ start:1869 stop:2156 length:288 start_codon:yes stop_codon:yes gene_type:complete